MDAPPFISIQLTGVRYQALQPYAGDPPHPDLDLDELHDLCPQAIEVPAPSLPRHGYHPRLMARQC